MQAYKDDDVTVDITHILASLSHHSLHTLLKSMDGNFWKLSLSLSAQLDGPDVTWDVLLKQQKQPTKQK